MHATASCLCHAGIASHLRILAVCGYPGRQHDKDGADVPLLGRQVQRCLSEDIAVEAVRPRLETRDIDRGKRAVGGGGGDITSCMAVVLRTIVV